MVEFHVIIHFILFRITDSGAKPYTMSTMSKGGLGSRGVKLSTSSAQSRATSKSGKSNDPKKEDGKKSNIRGEK